MKKERNAEKEWWIVETFFYRSSYGYEGLDLGEAFKLFTTEGKLKAWLKNRARHAYPSPFIFSAYSLSLAGRKTLRKDIERDVEIASRPSHRRS